MSLALDARQRAMLEEIGLRLFEPPSYERNDGTPPGPPRQAGGKPAGAAGVGAAGVVADLVVPAAPVERTPLPMRPTNAPSRERPEVERMEWDALEAVVAACRACGLCEGRTRAVFGAGDTRADWLIVGEAPGEAEDLQGEPFAGPAGKLLDNMLKALGLDRHRKVYLANALKCRPPLDRNPRPNEVAQCEPFLRRQVQLLQPKIILAMGRFAAQSLLATTEPIGKLRGRAHQCGGVPVVATYDLAYLLRNPADKAKAWSDLCFARELMHQPR
jgi:uracil-DNA glycosylase